MLFLLLLLIRIYSLYNMKVDDNSHIAIESLPNDVQSYGQYDVLYKIIFL